MTRRQTDHLVLILLPSIFVLILTTPTLTHLSVSTEPSSSLTTNSFLFLPSQEVSRFTSFIRPALTETPLTPTPTAAGATPLLLLTPTRTRTSTTAGVWGKWLRFSATQTGRRNCRPPRSHGVWSLTATEPFTCLPSAPTRWFTCWQEAPRW